MTKTVFNNRMVAHIWAQQTQYEGRGSSFFFDGPTIYSYGRHFPIAKFVTRGKNKCVLFTTKTYSVSTSKHIGYTHGALRGHDIPVFNVVDPTDKDHHSNYKNYKDWVAEAMTSAAKARVHAQMHMDRAFSLTSEANAYAKFFGLRWRLADPDFSEEFRDKVRKDEAKRKAKLKADEAKRKADMADAIQLWLKHEEPANSILPYNHGDTLLRINGAEVETSRGATVPVRHAMRLWPHVLAVRQGETAIPMVNFKIGLFTLNRIEANGDVVIGCHTIKYEQMERLAIQLGLPH